MEILGLHFTLKDGSELKVELTGIDANRGAITGWWLYKDGESRINEVETVIAYRRTVANQ